MAHTFPHMSLVRGRAGMGLLVLAMLQMGCGGAKSRSEPPRLLLPARLSGLLPARTNLALRADLARMRHTESYPSIRRMIEGGFERSGSRSHVDIGKILDDSGEFVAGVSYDASASVPSTVILLRGAYAPGSLDQLGASYSPPLRTEFLARDVWVIAQAAAIKNIRKKLMSRGSAEPVLRVLREKYGFDEALLCLVAEGTPDVHRRITQDPLFASVPLFREGPLSQVFSTFQSMGLRIDIDRAVRVQLGFHVASSALAQAAANQAGDLVSRYRRNFFVIALGLRPVFDNAFVYADNGRLSVKVEVPERDAAAIATRVADLSKLSSRTR
ncbi:MAG: hypothetical protein H6715_06490 [Myxococcales bacterium]|nr:hypothetical protein [Myxococcales bacterium]MCB9708551.1 hypothetical protein [Myxococcales bacterium]